MSPLCRQPNIFLPSGELNSDPFWIDGATYSALREETLSHLEGFLTSLDGLATPSAHYLLPSFDEDHLRPPLTSGGAERVSDVGFTLLAPTVPLGIQHDDFFGHTYQATYFEFLQNENGTCVPAQVMTTYECPPQTPIPCGDSVVSIAHTLSATHLLPIPADPSTMASYAPSFDHNRDPQTPSTSGNASVVYLPHISPLASPPRSDSLGLDSEGNTDSVPPSDGEDGYLPAQPTSSQKQGPKVRAKAKHTSRTASPTGTSSPESGGSITSPRSHRRAHPYKRPIAFRNFQSEDAARSISKLSEFRCPVVGCGREQKNGRIPDLKRHILTHGRWLEPDKWTCCGVPAENAHLFEPGTTEEGLIGEGAYMFKGKLMIGGCLKSFARRDALKRHVDNKNTPCVGDMDSYSY